MYVQHTLVLTLPVVRPPAPPPKPFVEPEEVLEDPAMGEQQDEEAHGMEEEAHRTEEKGTSDAVEAPSSSMSSTSTSKSTRYFSSIFSVMGRDLTKSSTFVIKKCLVPFLVQHSAC